MPDITSYNGIDMADIASINGQDVPAGSSGPPESNTGLLYFEGGGFNSRVPDAQEFFGDSAVSLYKAQLSTRTDIIKMSANNYHLFALDDSNNLYSMGWTNANYIGREHTTVPEHQLGLCLTNVSKFAAHDNGCWAIKTNGELWWCGSINSFATSSDTGTGSVYSTTRDWSQFGSDTDWIDIDCFPNFPAGSIAIKGSTGSEYLYSCGNNYWGRLGVGTTSGNTKPWTRVKSNSTTNWTETIEKMSIGYAATTVVTKSGKFFAFGDANEGHLGQGNTTDHLYPIQIGTDTDWDIPYAKTRLAGYCIKTDGSIYGSRRTTSYYNLSPPSSNRTYGQCGTDTDYEEILSTEYSTNTGKQIIFAKKNGTWYANWGSTFTPNSFLGNTANKVAPSDNTWVTINNFLEGNDITVGINTFLIHFKESNQALGEVLLIATAAT